MTSSFGIKDMRLLLFLALASIAWAGDDNAPLQTVTGVVYEAEKGPSHGIANVVVVAQDPDIDVTERYEQRREAMTDAQGAFTLQVPVTKELWGLTLRDARWVLARPVPVPESDATRLELQAWRGAQVSGRVVSRLPRPPLVSPRVYFLMTNYPTPDSNRHAQNWVDKLAMSHAEIGADGSFSSILPGLGEVEVTVGGDFVPCWHRLTVVAGQVVPPMELVLLAGATISGQFKVPGPMDSFDSLDARWERPDLIQRDGEQRGVTIDDVRMTAEGRIEAKHLLPGEYRLRIIDSTETCASPSYVSFTVPPDTDSVDLKEIHVPPGISVKGRILFGEAKKVPAELWVNAYPKKSHDWSARHSGRVADDGSYVVKGLSAGIEYEIHLTNERGVGNVFAETTVTPHEREREIVLDIEFGKR